MIPLEQPLDLTAPDAPAFLAGIQGNILKSHGRDHVAAVFVRFCPHVPAVRAWIAGFAAHVTSAAAQIAQKQAWKARGGAGELFASFLLSHAGYTAAGVPDAEIPLEANRTYFQLGMKNQAAAERPFNDPPKERWETPYQGDIHALVIMAHDDPKELDLIVAAVCKSLAPVAAAHWVERGSRLEFDFSSGRATIEHFGYEDGISDPVFLLQDADAERAARGSDKWDGVAPLDLALAAEPGHPDRFGSFLVFRKLEQNVRGFKATLEDLAKQYASAGIDADRAGAMAVGRFRDGTPIVPVNAPVAGAKLNNFNYADADPTGGVCPFHAHIRKTNPRGDLPIGMPLERTFRIARRGITYGERPDLVAGSKAPFPDRGVGLLFMSYQARIDGFAIQQEGSDSNDFAPPAVGVDAVIGQNAAPAPQEWPTGSGRKFTVANFVTLLGGEYFFAPSMPFLHSLATP